MTLEAHFSCTAWAWVSVLCKREKSFYLLSTPQASFADTSVMPIASLFGSKSISLILHCVKRLLLLEPQTICIPNFRFIPMSRWNFVFPEPWQQYMYLDHLICTCLKGNPRNVDFSSFYILRIRTTFTRRCSTRRQFFLGSCGFWDLHSYWPFIIKPSNSFWWHSSPASTWRGKPLLYNISELHSSSELM